MPSPIRSAPAAYAAPSQAAAVPEPAPVRANGRLLQWITHSGMPDPASRHATGPGDARTAAALRPSDANRCNLRHAIEARLPTRVHERIEHNREVSGSLRAAINLSFDHADAWMRRTLADAYGERALTSSELEEAVQRAQAFAEKLLNEADDQRLRQLIFEEEQQTGGGQVSNSLG